MRTARRQVSFLSVVQDIRQLAVVQRLFTSMDPDGLVWLKSREDRMPVLAKKDLDNIQGIVAE